MKKKIKETLPVVIISFHGWSKYFGLSPTNKKHKIKADSIEELLIKAKKDLRMKISTHFLISMAH